MYEKNTDKNYRMQFNNNSKCHIVEFARYSYGKNASKSSTVTLPDVPDFVKKDPKTYGYPVWTDANNKKVVQYQPKTVVTKSAVQYKSYFLSMYIENNSPTIEPTASKKYKNINGVKVILDVNNHAYLRWNMVEKAKGYKIYRKTNKNKKYKLLKTVKGHTCYDTNIDKNIIYYYKVVPYKKVKKKIRICEKVIL